MARKKAAKKKITRARLVARTAQRKPKPSRPAAAGKPTATLALPGMQGGDIQQTVRDVVNYVQQNPLAAAAVAIGVGVMLTSMYWEGKQAGGGKPRATRR